MVHNVNILIHVSTGTMAMIIGIVLLIARKGTPFHKRWGNVFVKLLLIVNVSAFLGWLFFRSNPFLLMLTLLAGYNTFSGYRIIKLKERSGTWLDITAPIVALGAGLFYFFYLIKLDSGWSPTVIYPTLGALSLVTIYDIFKSLFFHARIKTWWLYEHIYKIISSFGAVLSAFVGTVLPQYKPFSQALPGVFCWVIIVIFMIVVSRRKSTAHKIVSKPI